MSTAADAEVPARIIFLIGRPASGCPVLDLMSAPTCARMSLACPWATCKSPYRALFNSTNGTCVLVRISRPICPEAIE